MKGKITMGKGYAGVSFAPENIKEGGGLLNDEDVVIASAGFEFYDFNGKTDDRPCLCVVYRTSDGEEHTVYYSAGSPEWWGISEDGKNLMPLQSQDQTISGSSNFGRYLTSMYNAGLEEHIGNLGDDISELTGVSCHVVRVEKKGQDGEILIVSEIHGVNSTEDSETAQPEEAAPAGKKAAPSKKTAKAGADTIGAVERLVVGALEENGGNMDIPSLNAAAARKVQQQKMSEQERNAAIEVLFKDGFFTEESRPWEVKTSKKGGKVKQIVSVSDVPL